MIEWIVGGILLLGAVGKKLAESDNSGRASGMSDSELLKKARSGSTIDRAAAAAEYKSRHSDD